MTITLTTLLIQPHSSHVFFVIFFLAVAIVKDTASIGGAGDISDLCVNTYIYMQGKYMPKIDQYVSVSFRDLVWLELKFRYVKGIVVITVKLHFEEIVENIPLHSLSRIKEIIRIFVDAAKVRRLNHHPKLAMALY